ncbi:MAG: hypothetical protein KF813_01450 [Trueperaceae bacterium]|nr:hypothetical protein [Trueperaceae bacterium]
MMGAGGRLRRAEPRESLPRSLRLLSALALLAVSLLEPHLIAQGHALHEPHAHHGPGHSDVPDATSPYCFLCILPLTNVPTPEAATSQLPASSTAHRPPVEARVLARPAGSIRARAPPATHA